MNQVNQSFTRLRTLDMLLVTLLATALILDLAMIHLDFTLNFSINANLQELGLT